MCSTGKIRSPPSLSFLSPVSELLRITKFYKSLNILVKKWKWRSLYLLCIKVDKERYSYFLVFSGRSLKSWVYYCVTTQGTQKKKRDIKGLNLDFFSRCIFVVTCVCLHRVYFRTRVIGHLVLFRRIVPSFENLLLTLLKTWGRFVVSFFYDEVGWIRLFLVQYSNLQVGVDRHYLTGLRGWPHHGLFRFISQPWN